MYYMSTESGEIKTMAEWDEYITNELTNIYSDETELRDEFEKLEDFIEFKKDNNDFYPPFMICEKDGTALGYKK